MNFNPFYNNDIYNNGYTAAEYDNTIRYGVGNPTLHSIDEYPNFKKWYLKLSEKYPEKKVMPFDYNNFYETYYNTNDDTPNNEQLLDFIEGNCRNLSYTISDDIPIYNDASIIKFRILISNCFNINHNKYFLTEFPSNEFKVTYETYISDLNAAHIIYDNKNISSKDKCYFTLYDKIKQDSNDLILMTIMKYLTINQFDYFIENMELKDVEESGLIVYLILFHCCKPIVNKDHKYFNL